MARQLLQSWVRGLRKFVSKRPRLRRMLAWVPKNSDVVRNAIAKSSLYPLDLPDIQVQPGLDVLLLELPARYQPMMPNGLSYVANVLKNDNISQQIVDVNILLYHRFHQQRILEGLDPVVTPGGYAMVCDPWDNTYTGEWEKPEVLDYFWPEMQNLLDQIVVQRPRIIGLSVHANNRVVVRRFIEELRRVVPDVPILVGGYDCVHREIALSLVVDYDYMFIFECEMTLGPLVKQLLAGQRPKDLPGVLSRDDTPGRPWTPTPLLYELDTVDFPKYEWADLKLYQTFDCRHLVPITASRGCNWGRCRFCGECFPYRVRDPKKVADEIEYFYRFGLDVFHFNESDVNGDPRILYETCSEVIRRKLSVRLVGQLRINKANTLEYFTHLKKAGFTHLRFGVDGWSEHALRLQRKGYNIPMVLQNLRDCHAAGIYTTVNMVIGVPGETEQDVDEMIENMVACKDYIDAIESLNTLILTGGSEYYKNPDQYNIRFRIDRAEVNRKYCYYVPPELWYSEDPYIDQRVRLERLHRICVSLQEKGIYVGAFASQAVEQLQEEGRKNVAEAPQASS